jgi:hypothetical protein
MFISATPPQEAMALHRWCALQRDGRNRLVEEVRGDGHPRRDEAGKGIERADAAEDDFGEIHEVLPGFGLTVLLHKSGACCSL